jgi:flavin-dependent dehydrogenase
MKPKLHKSRIPLQAGAKVAVIGGGPAGAFFALHLLRQAARANRPVTVAVLERRRAGALREACPVDGWSGCNYCAGGISPKLNDVLAELGVRIPEHLIQCHIRHITVQGFWKNIEIDVPPGRRLLTVFRGSRPAANGAIGGLDAFILEQGRLAGAEIIPGEVTALERLVDGRFAVHYLASGQAGCFDADFVVAAAGVNAQPGVLPGDGKGFRLIKAHIPSFQPPQVRRSMIFEVKLESDALAYLSNTIHFVEYGSDHLRLEMCSIVPKRNYLTITLVGETIDRASQRDCPSIMREFLNLPHVRKLIPCGIGSIPVCACHPYLVSGSASNAFGDRIAVIGDLVTARLYKDGILSAERTARRLATALLEAGLDENSLAEAYEPILTHFRRDNRAAKIVFLLHRVVFGSSVLSRILYQAVISERKTTPAPRRRLENLLWRIASGDDEYRDILASMVHPSTLCSVAVSGALVTLRNYLTELGFGLRWEGFGRFTTGVAFERFETKRMEFSRLISAAHVSMPAKLEFERMYTIKIAAPQSAVFTGIGSFGEQDRKYMRPLWLQVQRVAGVPNQPGCRIEYRVVLPKLGFSLELEQVVEQRLVVYRVIDGFAKGGVMVFEIEPTAGGLCALSIYVGYNFARGGSIIMRMFWWVFRKSFPAFAHDVLWNHSLCELKDVVEADYAARRRMEPIAKGDPTGGGLQKVAVPLN